LERRGGLGKKGKEKVEEIEEFGREGL